MNQSTPLTVLRNLMKSEQVDAYIVPSSDPHQNEYIPEHWQFRRWFSGFSGSAGTVVITLDFAGLWTDSRYFLQAEKQLSGSGIALVKLTVPHTPEHLDWLTGHLPAGSKVAIDNTYFSVSSVRMMKSIFDNAGIELVTGLDLLTGLWDTRDKLPSDPVFSHDIQYAGKTRADKIDEVRVMMRKNQADFHLITTLDDIAWLLNLRGNDISFCPFFVSYCLIGIQSAVLFCDLKKIPSVIVSELMADKINLMPYESISEVLQSLPAESNLYLAPERVNHWLFSQIPAGVRIIEGMNYTTGLKSIKNPVEIEGLREVMKKDGVAWVKTMKWIEEQMVSGNYPTELSVASKIAEYRSMQLGYLGESFHPISSYDWHGAIVHYSVNQEESLQLEPKGIFLLDSGGHFFQGTTDTTRTIALSAPSQKQKDDFTLALKGTMDVSMLKFPKGTKGYQMDILARKALWDHGINYGHGTGHGVGFLLSVHEGPQTIGTSASGYMNVTFEPGMVTTVEPAIYREGEYGMRTENMTVVVEDVSNEFGSFYRFDTITAVPIDKTLLSMQLLSKQEVEWLNHYHKWVFEQLSPRLADDEVEWLRIKTLPI